MTNLKIRDPRRNKIMTVVDRLFYCLITVVELFKFKENNPLNLDEVKKILLLRTDNIGDAIMMTPVLAALRAATPSATIDVLVRPPAVDVFASNPDVNRIYSSNVPWFSNKPNFSHVINLIKDVFAIRKEQYDIIIDFRGDFRNIFFYLYLGGGRFTVSYIRSGGAYMLTHAVPYNEEMHAVDKNLKLLSHIGIDADLRDMRVYLNEESRQTLFKKVPLISDCSDSSLLLIGVHPGATSLTRRWNIDKFADLISSLLKNYNCIVYISGDRSEEALGSKLQLLLDYNPKVLNLTGKLTLSELASLLDMTDLFICNETGVMHLSVALNTKTISIYGPQLPSKFAHYNAHSKVLWKKFDCCPCLHHLACKVTNSNRAMCLDAIEVQDVMNEVNVFLN